MLVCCIGEECESLTWQKRSITAASSKCLRMISVSKKLHRRFMRQKSGNEKEAKAERGAWCKVETCSR